jgi:hypothetical protein
MSVTISTLTGPTITTRERALGVLGALPNANVTTATGARILAEVVLAIGYSASMTDVALIRLAERHLTEMQNPGE